MMKICKKCPNLPIVRKCCFCVPIRKGITIFGYVNLVLSLLSVPLLSVLLMEYVITGKTIDSHMDPLVHLSLAICFVLVDVAMNIVLLVGAHKKRRSLLKIYLYFGIVFQALTLCVDLVFFDYREYIQNSVYFLFLGLNIYLLFLVYSTVRVIEEEASEVQYVAYQDHQLNL